MIVQLRRIKSAIHNARWHSVMQCVIFVLALSDVHAEIYKGIAPLNTLSDLKQRFPGADFEKLKPAWAQATDVLYSVTGAGLTGTIVVKFIDPRPWYQDLLDQSRGTPEERREQSGGTLNETPQQERLRALAQGADDGITVEWVRWIPDRPISLQRFIAKYGPPTKSDFTEDDFQPYREWSARGLIAFLDDAAKSVVRVDYVFTADEQRRAWKAKTGFIPPSLGRLRPSP